MRKAHINHNNQFGSNNPDGIYRNALPIGICSEEQFFERILYSHLKIFIYSHLNMCLNV